MQRRGRIWRIAQVFLFLLFIIGGAVWLRLMSVQQKPPAKIFAVDDSVSAFLRPFAQYLADGLNRAPGAVAQVPPECAEIRIYAINWLDGGGLPVLSDTEKRCGIVWYGSRQNVLVDGLEKYFRVWASSPLLYSYLRTAKVEAAYVPLFAFPADYKAENNTGGEKFWALIGQDAMVEEAIKVLKEGKAFPEAPQEAQDKQ